MSSGTKGNISRDFPDFFTFKDSIPTTTTQLQFNNNIYWMSKVAKDESPVPQNVLLRPYEDNEEGMLLDCEDIEDSYDITLTKSGKFTTTFYVPHRLLSFLMKPKGVKLQQIQRSTRTSIKIASEKNEVKITGSTERNVASACNRINAIIFRAREQISASHFISIRLFSENVEINFLKFKNEILQNLPRGVEECIFQNPKKLHLTITVLTLVDDQEIATAKELLQTCYDKVISNLFPKGLDHYIILQGVEIMNDDPSEVSVLYAKIAGDEKLQQVADKIYDYFCVAKLAKRQYDSVKLHATLMNASFRNFGEKQKTFDATGILKKYKEFYFGQVKFEAIHLSVRFASSTTEDGGYYPSILSISI